MSTAKNAARALRAICEDDAMRNSMLPNWHFEKSDALNAFQTALSDYAQRLPECLDLAYNKRARHDGWYPVPIGTPLLSQRHAQSVQVNETDDLLRKRILSWAGFKALGEAARDAGVLLKLSVRPDGVSITCDFRQETEGEVRLFVS